jgi:rhamnulokinase
VLAHIEQMLGCKSERDHIPGGGSRNKMLTQLTAQRTGLPVESGKPKSSTTGNPVVPLATNKANGHPVRSESVRHWAECLCLR